MVSVVAGIPTSMMSWILGYVSAVLWSCSDRTSVGCHYRVTFQNLAMEHPPPIYTTSMFAFKSCQPRINKPCFFFLRGYPSPVIICYSKGALRSESSTMCLSRLEPSALWTMLYAECISMYGIFTYKTVSFVGEMLVNIPYIDIPYMEYKILNCQK